MRQPEGRATSRYEISDALQYARRFQRSRREDTATVERLPTELPGAHKHFVSMLQKSGPECLTDIGPWQSDVALREDPAAKKENRRQ